MKRKVQNLQLIVALTLALAAGAVHAATTTWTGAVDANWTTPGNWTPGAPTAGDALVFNANTQPFPVNDFAAGTPFGPITFSAATSGLTLQGNRVLLTGNLVNLSPGSQTLELPLEITNSVTFDSGTYELLVAGTLSGTASSTITKVGAGTLVISNKTWTGSTIVSNGLVVANNANGNYLLAGGSLKLNYGSYWDARTIDFAANSQFGTDNGRLDFAGTLGTNAFTWTKIGTGTINMTSEQADPTARMKASAIYVAEGTLGSLRNAASTPLAHWGGTNVSIAVSNGAVLALNDDLIAPNSSIVLAGGAGTGNGVLVSGRVNAGSANYTNTFVGSITLQSESTIGTFGGILVLRGNIGGTGPLTKTGVQNTYSQNKLVLRGTNTWTGGLIVSTGLVQLASSGALPNGSDLTLASNGSIDMNGNISVNALMDDGSGASTIDNTSTNLVSLTCGGNNQAVSFTGPVKNTGGGALSIIKLGAGAATFTGANSYSGSNVVLGGSLAIRIPNNTRTNGLVHLADNTTLSLAKGAAGASIKTTGATLGVAGPTTLNIDLGIFGSPTVPVIAATNGTGILTVGGEVTLNISGNQTVMSFGQFPLISYKTRAGNGRFVLGALPPQISASIVTNASGKSIDLLITSTPVTKWVGNVNNLWDVATTMNWSVLNTPSTYQEGVGVEFTDSAATNIVDLTVPVYPAGTLVNASTNYTFTGMGSLNGGDLIKNGPGTLLFTTMNNSFANATIAEGTVQFGDGGSSAFTSYGNIQNEGSLVFNLWDPTTVAGWIAGEGRLVKQNTNTLYLGAANSYSGGTMVNGGVVSLAYGTPTSLGTPAPGIPLATIASGAALDIGGKLVVQTNAILAQGVGLAPNQGVIHNTMGGTCVGCGDVGINNLQLLADTTIGNDGGDWVIGANGVGIYGNGYNLTKVGGNIIYLRAPAITPPAQFTVGGGGILIESANCFGAGTLVILSNNASLDSWGNNSGFASYTIANNILVTNGGGRIMNTRGHWWNTPDAQTYNGNITVADTLTFQNSSARGAILGTLTVNGNIAGSGSVVKTGPYLVTLNGQNTYAGLTAVSNGTLAVSIRQQGGGGFLVDDAGTLDVPNQLGSLTLPMSSLTMGSSTGAVLNLMRVTTLSTSNALITATNLTLVGNNRLQLPGIAFVTLGQFPLIKYTGTVSGGGTFSLATPRGFPGYISNNVANSSIDLVVNGANPVKWVGNVSTNWDINATANWIYQSGSTTYQQASIPGDGVTFDDTAVSTAVGLSTPVSPALVIVNNTSAKDYVFRGTNITGPATLVKMNSGSLILSNLNDNFTGSTAISGGTIRIGSDNALTANGLVTIQNGGTLDMAGLNPSGLTLQASGAGVNGAGAIVANYSGGGQTRGPGTITMTGDLTIGGTNRWDLRNGAKTLNSPTPDFTLTKVGPNLISLVAATVSPNLGDIRILGGSLGFETTTTGHGATNKTIYIGNGGALSFYQSTVPVQKSIICSNNANITANGGNSASQNIIAAPVYLDSGRINFNANYNNAMTFSNTISGPGGVWIQWNSDITFAAPNTYQGTSDVDGRLKLVNNATIATTNNITVNNGGSGVLMIYDNAVVAGRRLQIWSGPATGALIVRNNGTINSGVIQIGNAFADVSGRTDGRLTLQSGQTFRIDNGGRFKGDLVAPANSIVSPGEDFTLSSTGFFTNSVTLQAGSTNVMDISKVGGVLTNDMLNVLGTLTRGGTLYLNKIGADLLAPGDTFTLFSAGALAGSFDSVVAQTPGQNVTFNLDTPAPGQIQVASAVATVPTTLNAAVVGNSMQLSWPASHTGWRLVVQTNLLNTGLSTNWFTWPNSTTVNQVAIPIDPSNGTVFYRLVYP